MTLKHGNSTSVACKSDAILKRVLHKAMGALMRQQSLAMFKHRLTNILGNDREFEYS